jgi:hypothetical protein
MKVKVWVSGWITEADGTVKTLVVAEREDGERLEAVYPKEFDFDVAVNEMVKMIKDKPKKEKKILEKEVEIT